MNNDPKLGANVGIHDVTQLLAAWSQGDANALEKLTPLVYKELHRLARAYMAKEQVPHVLQTTALINEAFLRLIDGKRVEWRNRAHFFALAAKLMRRVLVDFARSRRSQKRGKGAPLDSLAQLSIAVAPKSVDLVALDFALKKLAAVDQRKSQIVELRFFGGLSVEETAEVLNIAQSTVYSDFNLAKLWLLSELRGENR
jgi:RNA polymerase sigma factor (TIGR02999 family)